MKSIKMKILIATLSVVVVGICVLSVFSAVSTRRSTMFTLETALMETVETASLAIQNDLYEKLRLAGQLGIDKFLTQELPSTSDSNYNNAHAEKIAYLNTIQNFHDLNFVTYYDKSGKEIFSGKNFSDRDYFTQCKQTLLPSIQDPSVNITTKSVEMMVSAPIVVDGQFNGLVAFGVDAEELSEMVKQIEVGEGGNATIIDSNGVNIAYTDVSYVLEQYNAQEEAKKDPSLQSLADLEKDLMNGNSGFGSCTFDGVEEFMAYTPIANTNGWGLYISVNSDIFLSAMDSAFFGSINVGIAILILVIIVVIIIANTIAKPAIVAIKQLPAVAEGDFTVDLKTKGNDEISKMMDMFNSVIKKTREAMSNIKTEAITMNEIGEKLAVDATETASAVHEIASNVASVKTQVINEAAGVEEMNATIGQIITSVEGLDNEIQRQVESISESMAATEEMVANIRSVSAVLENNGEEVKKLSTAADNGRDSVTATLDITQRLESQSEGLIEASNVIQSVASQTSLLAMNAAIEAAHAGESGKGFAVVADEIRKLAENSTNQSKSISNVLQQVKTSILELNESAQFVNEQFESIFNMVDSVKNHETQVSNMMQEQSAANEQVLQSMHSISAISKTVQNESSKILTGSHEIGSEIQKLNEITSSINLSMSEMSAGAEQIRTASQNVNNMSVSTQESIQLVTEQLKRFTV